MPRIGLRRNRRSFGEMTSRLPTPLDPLDFITSGRSGGARDAYLQIHGAIHGGLVEVERTINAIFERLRPEGEVTDRMIIEANGDVRTELARASSFADMKRDDLERDIARRTEVLFIQRLILAPEEEPPVQRWVNLADRAVRRDLPPVSEPSHTEFGSSPSDRRRRLARWQSETDEWLETLCLNRVGEIIAALLEEVADYSATWADTTNELRRHANIGGQLYEDVNDPEQWTFSSDDPTVKNLLSGAQAQDISNRISNRFQLSNHDVLAIAESVYSALDGKSVYGAHRVESEVLEELLALATARKIRDSVSVDTGFLSLISTGARFGEELGELLVDMHMGTTAMEEKMWRVGEVRVGHVDCASGVGITSSSLHDSVIRGLGGGRKFAAVEGHPGDNHRIEVQMSTVGAPISDLAIFRDMVNAWYSWHFEDRRGGNGNQDAWVEAMQKESWKLYPDVGKDSGTHGAIIELIDDDMRQLWNGRGDIATRLVSGQLDGFDKDLSRGSANGQAYVGSSSDNE